MMVLTPGARQAVMMAAGWLFSGTVAVCALVYSAELKDAARDLLGLSEGRQAGSVRPAAPARQGAGRSVEIKVGPHGHYFTVVEVNGRKLDVMVDTGASMIALTYEDARRAGLAIRDSDFTQSVQTANGVARFAPVTLDRVSVRDITLHNVAAAVGEPGRLRTTLLGMSFLGRLQRVDMRPGVMILSD